MQKLDIAIPQRAGRTPWNKGKLLGAKPPLRTKHVWAIRTKLQVGGRTHDLAMLPIPPRRRTATKVSYAEGTIFKTKARRFVQPEVEAAVY